MRLLATTLLFAASFGFGTMASAVTYDEAVDGDLDEYAIPLFALDHGLNTFTGTVSRLPSDSDRLKFTIPVGATLDGLMMTVTSGYASPTGVYGWNPVLNFWGPDGYTYEYVDGLTMTTPVDIVMPASLFPTTTDSVFEIYMSHGFGVSDPGAQLTYDYVVSIDVSPVPLPAALGSSGLGLALLSLLGWRRRSDV